MIAYPGLLADRGPSSDEEEGFFRWPTVRLQCHSGCHPVRKPFLKEIPMQYRPLGKSGIDIAPLVFGGNVFGWTLDEPNSFALLDRFVEAGCNAIDTADSYSAWAPGNSGGESESIIGKWLEQRKRRDDVIIMTKIGMLEGRKRLTAANI